jgi:hypothetical protein
MVSVFWCRTRLMLLWFAWSMALILIVFLQLVGQHYGADWKDALTWLLPAILPTTSLVVGVWASEVARADRTERVIARSAFRMVAIASALYLSFVTLVIAMQPFYAGPAIELMRQSALILAPLQGVVSAFLGIFFSQTGQQPGTAVSATAEPQQETSQEAPKAA